MDDCCGLRIVLVPRDDEFGRFPLLLLYVFGDEAELEVGGVGSKENGGIGLDALEGPLLAAGVTNDELDDEPACRLYGWWL